MPLSRPVNDAHPATPDFFQNLVITEPPIDVAHVDFIEDALERLVILSLSAQTSIEQAVQAQTAANPRCRTALCAGNQLVFQLRRTRNVGRVHIGCGAAANAAHKYLSSSSTSSGFSTVCATSSRSSER